MKNAVTIHRYKISSTKATNKMQKNFTTIYKAWRRTSYFRTLRITPYSVIPYLSKTNDPFRSMDKAGLKDALEVFIEEEPYTGISHILGFIDRHPHIRDVRSYSRLLDRCLRARSYADAKVVHSHMVVTGFEPVTYLWNRLIGLYCDLGRLRDACQVFDKMPDHNKFSWNILISGHATRGLMGHAQFLFDRCPDRDVICWNVMVVGYAKRGMPDRAMGVFREMLGDSIRPNESSFVNVVGVCGLVEQGMGIHGSVLMCGFVGNFVLVNVLIDMYCKFKRLDLAERLFEESRSEDVVTWTAMITGYQQSSLYEEALKLFSRFIRSGMKVDPVLLPTVLSASASLAALAHGRQVHSYTIKSGTEMDVYVASALLNMYFKCGCLDSANLLFQSMRERSVVSWNTVIAGLAQNGLEDKALKMFKKMIRFGVKPNEVTFLGVLTACCHGGLMVEGHLYFDSMIRDYNISPEANHYACMVDLYGRAGYLDDAVKLINEMGDKADVVIWSALLNACRVHGNAELAVHATKKLLQLEGGSSVSDGLLSDLYSSGCLDDVTKFMSETKSKELKKEVSCSWIEIGNKVHRFVFEDRSHPQTKEIYSVLHGMIEQMKAMGYAPGLNFAMHDAEENNIEQRLLCHGSSWANLVA